MTASPSGQTELGLQIFFPIFTEHSPQTQTGPMNFRNPSSLIALLLLAFSLCAADSLTITAINLYGNRQTQERVVRMFLPVSIGMQFDSTMLDSTRNHLMATNLFTKVEVFPQYQRDGMRLLIILREKLYWGLTGYGGELYSTVYGRGCPTWWNVHGGLSYSNFRGVMEQIALNVSFPKRLSAGLSWNKPILETPFYLKLGSGVSFAPDLFIPWDRFNVYGYATLGRKIRGHSRIYASLMPSYGRRWWKGSTGGFDTLATYADRMPNYSAKPFANFAYDAHGFDTTLLSLYVPRDNSGQPIDSLWIVAQREWKGISSDTLALRQAPYRELMFIMGWSTNRCRTTFDIDRGYAFGSSLQSNALYPRNRNYVYLQWDTDTRAYRPGLLPGHALAVRARTSLRIDSSDVYDALYAGGESSVRGYPRGWYGRQFIANNQLLINAEYRFPIWATPRFDYPILADYFDFMKQFYLRLDGALILDGGYLWHNLADMFSSRMSVGGVGCGAGLRVLAPTLQRSVCLDVVFGLDPRWISLKKEYYQSRREKGKFSLPYWFPTWDLYIDLPF
jgi:outer membrane protein assembly factor BamA